MKKNRHNLQRAIALSTAVISLLGTVAITPVYADNEEVENKYTYTTLDAMLKDGTDLEMIDLFVNGTDVQTALMYEGKAYIPLNVFRTLKIDGFEPATVENKDNHIYIKYKGTDEHGWNTIELQLSLYKYLTYYTAKYNIGNNYKWSMSDFRKDDIYLIQKDGYNYIPAQIVRDCMGIIVNWDEDTRSIIIPGTVSVASESTKIADGLVGKDEVSNSIYEPSFTYTPDRKAVEFNTSRKVYIDTEKMLGGVDVTGRNYKTNTMSQLREMYSRQDYADITNGLNEDGKNAVIKTMSKITSNSASLFDKTVNKIYLIQCFSNGLDIVNNANDEQAEKLCKSLILYKGYLNIVNRTSVFTGKLKDDMNVMAFDSTLQSAYNTFLEEYEKAPKQALEHYFKNSLVAIYQA